MTTMNFTDKLADKAAEKAMDTATGEVTAKMVEGMETWISAIFTFFWGDIRVSTMAEGTGVINFLTGATHHFVIGGLVLSIIIQCIHLCLARDSRPADTLIKGIGMAVLVTSLSLPLTTMIATMGDQWSRWVIDSSAASGNMGENVLVIMGLGGGGGPVIGFLTAIIFGIVVVIACLAIGLVMIAMMLLLPVALAVMPILAAFFTFESARQGLHKLVCWTMALLLMKPAIATVLSAGFLMLGEDGLIYSTSLEGAGLAAIKMMGGTVLLILAGAAPLALAGFLVPVSAKVDGMIQSGGGGGMALHTGMVAAGAVSNGLHMASPVQDGSLAGTQAVAGGAPSGAVSAGATAASGAATGGATVATQTVKGAVSAIDKARSMSHIATDPQGATS